MASLVGQSGKRERNWSTDSFGLQLLRKTTNVTAETRAMVTKLVRAVVETGALTGAPNVRGSWEPSPNLPNSARSNGRYRPLFRLPA